jgi:hypothetical protein
VGGSEQSNTGRRRSGLDPVRCCAGTEAEAHAVHETRNFLLVIVLLASVLWAVLAWFVFGQDTALLWPQRIVSIILIPPFAAWLLYALKFEDKLPNRLKQLSGVYYEADGLSFMPMIRTTGEQAELSVYYQNRFENPVQAIVHLRPPEDSFVIRPGVRDVHIAFKAGGGDFGVIHQPIAVPEHLQGEVIDVQLAAGSYYPRSQGARWRKEIGMPCGSLLVDWAGAAFKTGVHEVSGEVELNGPVTLHLSMPAAVRAEPTGRESWKQEQIAAGTPG